MEEYYVLLDSSVYNAENIICIIESDSKTNALIKFLNERKIPMEESWLYEVIKVDEYDQYKKTILNRILKE